MVKVKMLSPISIGGAIYPKGMEVEVDEDIARAYANDVEIISAKNEDADENELAKKTVSELKSICDNLGIEIPAGSKKADIVALVEAHEEEENEE